MRPHQRLKKFQNFTTVHLNTFAISLTILTLVATLKDSQVLIAIYTTIYNPQYSYFEDPLALFLR